MINKKYIYLWESFKVCFTENELVGQSLYLSWQILNLLNNSTINNLSFKVNSLIELALEIIVELPFTDISLCRVPTLKKNNRKFIADEYFYCIEIHDADEDISIVFNIPYSLGNSFLPPYNELARRLTPKAAGVYVNNTLFIGTEDLKAHSCISDFDSIKRSILELQNLKVQ